MNHRESIKSVRNIVLDAQERDIEHVYLRTSDAAALLGGRLNPSKIDLASSKRHAAFDASLVPFLRPVLEMGPDPFSSVQGGITVLRSGKGGVDVMATNGITALVAHDPDGYCSEGGIRFTMPKLARDACEPRHPHTLLWDGCSEAIPDSIPDYAIPGRVYVYEFCLIVMPLGQPEGIPSDDGGALINMGLDSEYGYSPEHFTIHDATDWRSMIKSGHGDMPSFVSYMTMSIVGKAMEAMPDVVWEILHPCSKTVVFRSVKGPFRTIMLAQADPTKRHAHPAPEDEGMADV